MTTKSYNPVRCHTRWHYFDHAGNKIIKRFPVDAKLPAPWKRGCGPHKPDIAQLLRTHLKQNVHSRPVSDETKQKMRDAKLGKKCTSEHKDNLRKAQQRLRDDRRAKIEQAYQLAEQFGKEYWQAS